MSVHIYMIVVYDCVFVFLFVLVTVLTKEGTFFCARQIATSSYWMPTRLKVLRS